MKKNNIKGNVLFREEVKRISCKGKLIIKQIIKMRMTEMNQKEDK